MPIYEYECQHCHERFEVLKRLKDTSEEKCPQCGEPSPRILSGFAVKGQSSASTAHRPSCAPLSGG